MMRVSRRLPRWGSALPGRSHPRQNAARSAAKSRLRKSKQKTIKLAGIDPNQGPGIVFHTMRPMRARIKKIQDKKRRISAALRDKSRADGFFNRLFQPNALSLRYEISPLYDRLDACCFACAKIRTCRNGRTPTLSRQHAQQDIRL